MFHHHWSHREHHIDRFHLPQSLAVNCVCECERFVSTHVYIPAVKNKEVNLVQICVEDCYDGEPPNSQELAKFKLIVAMVGLRFPGRIVESVVTWYRAITLACQGTINRVYRADSIDKISQYTSYNIRR